MIGHQDDLAGGDAIFLRKADRHGVITGAELDRDDGVASCRERAVDGLPIAADEIAATVDDDLGRVYGGIAEHLGLAALPRDRIWKRIAVGPSEVVPIIDVKTQRQDAAPLGELANVGFRRRAGAATLRRVEFNHRGPRRGRGDGRPSE